MSRRIGGKTPRSCERKAEKLARKRSEEGLRKARDELRWRVQEQVVDLTSAIAELERTKHAAEAANCAKSTLVANTCHELRTSISAILGMLEMALPKVNDPMVQDCLRTARESAGMLLTLLNDLLDSAKVESGALELESTAFSLRQLLDQTTRILSVRASEKGLNFYCRMWKETPDAVMGDRMRLQQILLNLAGNAIKFTEHGLVEIDVRVGEGLGMSDRFDRRDWGLEGKDDHVDLPESLLSNPQSPIPDSPPSAPAVTLEFAVRDTGMGISPAGQKRLFRPFAQADASVARRFGGTGLGLSICKRLVELMGGRIWVASELGRGSTFLFTVRLPLATEVMPDAQATVVASAAACNQLHVLLVEDNPANQKVVTHLLRNRGHRVQIAGTGREAVDLTQHNRYDAVLMDVQLPEMDGLQATAVIRKRTGARVPIIAMTAHTMKEDGERCLAAGMDAFLSKPVQAQEMFDLVESLARGALPGAEFAAATPSPHGAT